MKLKVLAVSILIITFFSLQAQEKSAWVDDYEQAMEICKSEHKLLLLVFSGSDWCKPCIRLKKEILDDSTFQTAIADKWVLYNADFPYKQKLAKEKVKTNEALADRYNFKGVFPKVVLLDEDGKVKAEAGYRNVSPTEYIEFLEQQMK